MYYDDEARRFNFVSGLLLGGVLGVVFALIGRPALPSGKRRPLRDGYRRARSGASSGLSRLSGGVADVVAAARSAVPRR